MATLDSICQALSTREGREQTEDVIQLLYEAATEIVNHTDSGNPVAWRLVQKARELEGGP